MSDSGERSNGDRVSIAPLLLGFGGFLTIATGLSVTVLAFVFASSLASGYAPIALLSLLGIAAGVGIFYVGVGELLRSGL